MKNSILFILLYTKFMLLILPSYKRQKYVDKLNVFVENCLLDFDDECVNELKMQMSLLTEFQLEELFLKNFLLYKFFRFGAIRLEVDEYHLEDCRTFKQFNRVLKLSFMAIDYEKSTLI